MNPNTISLSGMVVGAPSTQTTKNHLTYTSFVLITHGSYLGESDNESPYRELHRIVCVGALGAFAHSIKVNDDLEVEGELRTRRQTVVLGNHRELQISYQVSEVVATSIRPYRSYAAAKQTGNADDTLIVIYQPEDV